MYTSVFSALWDITQSVHCFIPILFFCAVLATVGRPPSDCLLTVVLTTIVVIYKLLVLVSKDYILIIMYQVRVITVYRLLTDFVCLYTYEFWLSLCKIVRSSVILLLPLFSC